MNVNGNGVSAGNKPINNKASGMMLGNKDNGAQSNQDNNICNHEPFEPNEQ